MRLIIGNRLTEAAERRRQNFDAVEIAADVAEQAMQIALQFGLLRSALA